MTYLRRYTPLPRQTKPLKRSWIRLKAKKKPQSVLHPNKRYPVDREEYAELLLLVFRRSAGFCEAQTEGGSRCMSPMVCDPHHVIKRSRGGPDTLANILAVCRACHDRIHGNVLHWSKNAN